MPIDPFKNVSHGGFSFKQIILRLKLTRFPNLPLDTGDKEIELDAAAAQNVRHFQPQPYLH